MKKIVMVFIGCLMVVNGDVVHYDKKVIKEDISRPNHPIVSDYQIKTNHPGK